MIQSNYTIYGFWGPRRETPEALAPRFDRLIDRLALIDPVFGNWFWLVRYETPILFTLIRDQLAQRIAAAVTLGDDGEPEPIFGYRFGTLNTLDTTPQLIDLSNCAGSWIEDKDLHPNSARLGTDWYVAPDPAIVTYRIFKPALLALAESFETSFCAAFPGDLVDLWPTGPKFRFGWVNYVCPRFAPLITPPQTAIVEYRPDGGLLMAATDETFVTSNPQHMAVARDIEAALAPLNALPWPPDGNHEYAPQ
jgi:hypothetical protein